jgi:hypothetical protein
MDLESYVRSYTDLVEHIMNLTGVHNLTFDGRDLAGPFNLDVNHFIEGWTGFADMNALNYPQTIMESYVLFSFIG